MATRPTHPAALPPGCVPDCPGCEHRGWPAPRSAAQKMHYLRRVLAPWRERLGELLAPPAAARLGYRRKTSLHCEWDGRRWLIGMRRRDRLVGIPQCPVHAPPLRRSLARLGAALPPPQAGFALRYYVQAGAQVTLVLKQARLPPLGWLDRALTDALAADGVEGLWLNLYPSAGCHKFAKRGWHLLWGRPRSRTAEGLLQGPASFQQLLPALHGRALRTARAYLVPRAGDGLLDLYCGSGAGLRCWAEGQARVLGVEADAEAVDCARANAPGVEVLRGRCAQRLPQLTAFLEGFAPQRRLLYLNPPRPGLEPPVCDWLAARARPRRLAYLSCGAGGLARDLARLSAGGYRVDALQPFDFFPQTRQIEVLALLRREAGTP